MLITFTDSEFDGGIEINEFFGEAGGSSVQASDCCSKPGVYSFNSFGKLFSDQMLVVG